MGVAPSVRASVTWSGFTPRIPATVLDSTMKKVRLEPPAIFEPIPSCAPPAKFHT